MTKTQDPETKPEADEQQGRSRQEIHDENIAYLRSHPVSEVSWTWHLDDQRPKNQDIVYLWSFQRCLQLTLAITGIVAATA